MNAQQAENLRILIRHMENNVNRTLNMDDFYQPCGTPACALGEAQAMGLVKFKLDEYDCGPVFGLHFETASRLFGTATANAWKRQNVTPQEWAMEARKALAENGYTMDEPAKPEPFEAFMAKVMEPIKEAAH